ncbi:hypothetical protein H2200_009265 [Cladophialophora chaetospira]|uniref:MAPEG family protein n=1 Tax=Cladophialophora chaetospira TaxID=386627 RepID=A0AA38X3S2_9EURO|nr:hypothetical protein H2200_009265 [Cladophialophora chaetospira]
MSKEVKTQAEKSSEKARGNGIVNPSGGFAVFYTPLYLAFIPVTSYLTRPSGILEKTITTTIKYTPGLSTTTPARTIPALSALYVFFTFGASGVFSVAGQAMSRQSGLDDSNPREFVTQMRGLPQRLRSAHLHLMENFAGFALAAALAQTLAPGDRQVVNLLGLHVLLKCAVHYPAYLANVPPVRTLAHVAATASVINVLWRLAVGQ